MTKLNKAQEKRFDEKFYDHHVVNVAIPSNPADVVKPSTPAEALRLMFW